MTPSGLTVDVLPSSDQRWDSRLSAVRRDIYHTRHYHEVAQGAGEGTAFLIVVGDSERGLAWPYLLRPLREVEGLESQEGMDVSSVYGYPGPLAWGCAPGDPFVARAWSLVLDAWRDQGVVSAFTRFHPILDNASLGHQFRLSNDPPGGHLSTGTETVSIDCSLAGDVAAKAYSRVLRQEIASARRVGLQTHHDTDWVNLGAFVDLYGETMARSGADERYRMTMDDVKTFSASVAPHAHLLVTTSGSAVAAAGIFTEYDGIVQAHRVGTNIELRDHSPLKVLLDDARQWAHERGNDVLHLGGGRGGRADSLFRFKGRFSSRRHLFHVGTWILQPDLYAALARGTATGSREVPADFFPAYRAPR
jgi:hypothetical protein